MAEHVFDGSEIGSISSTDLIHMRCRFRGGATKPNSKQSRPRASTSLPGLFRSDSQQRSRSVTPAQKRTIQAQTASLRSFLATPTPEPPEDRASSVYTWSPTRKRPPSTAFLTSVDINEDQGSQTNSSQPSTPAGRLVTPSLSLSTLPPAYEKRRSVSPSPNPPLTPSHSSPPTTSDLYGLSAVTVLPNTTTLTTTHKNLIEQSEQEKKYSKTQDDCQKAMEDLKKMIAEAPEIPDKLLHTHQPIALLRRKSFYLGGLSALWGGKQQDRSKSIMTDKTEAPTITTTLSTQLYQDTISQKQKHTTKRKMDRPHGKHVSWLNKNNSVMLQMGLAFTIPHWTAREAFSHLESQHEALYSGSESPQSSGGEGYHSTTTGTDHNPYYSTTDNSGLDSDGQPEQESRAHTAATFITTLRTESPTGRSTDTAEATFASFTAGTVTTTLPITSGGAAIGGADSVYYGTSRTRPTSCVAERLAVVKERRKIVRAERRAEIEYQSNKTDTLRFLSSHLKEVEFHMHQRSLRICMWLTVISAVVRDVWEAPLKARILRRMRVLVLPSLRRHIQVKQRKVARKFLLALYRDYLRPLTVKQLKATGPLFETWPDRILRTFARSLQPNVYLRGEYICHQGDPSPTLYILSRGTVEVIIRNPESKSKGRGLPSGKLVATLSATRYIGEYGIYADEPRSATLRCATRCHCWVATAEVFWFGMSRLPRDVYDDIIAKLEERMITLYPVRPATLMCNALFAKWHLDDCTELVKELQPRVFRPDTWIIKEGESGDGMYLITRGRVEVKSWYASARNKLLWNDAAEDHPKKEALQLGVFATGKLIGERPCVFLERHWYSAKALSTVQAWRLRKSALLNRLLLHPDWFIQAKEFLNRDLAQHLPKPIQSEFLKCKLFRPPMPFRLVGRIYDKQFRPVVYEAGAKLATAKTVITELFYIQQGTAKVESERAFTEVGEWLGVNLSVSGNPVWPSDVICKERCDCWVLSIEGLVNLLVSYLTSPSIKIKFKQRVQTLKGQLTNTLFFKPGEQ